MVVKRRRMTNSRGVNNVILSVHGGKHHGLGIENGFYVSRISPGSVAAREGSIAVGDGLLTINGKSIENVKKAVDLLGTANSTLTLQLSKCMPCPSSPPGSVSNYPNSSTNAHRKIKKSSPNAHSPHLGQDEEDPIAELDSVIEIHSKMLSKPSKRELKEVRKEWWHFWPKYKGPLIQYNEVGTVARYPSHIRPPSYNGTSSPGSLLDYSVVSAYPNKDVLEYYKNRNRTRPRSALFGISDSDCLSSLESNASSQCGKNLMSIERTSFNHSDGIPLSFSSPDRPINAHSGHITDQRGMTHSHHSHNHTTGNHGNALVVSPLPSASRYSSPPGLSVYTSRSGDSLLSVSVTESMLVDGRSFHTHTDSGRYSLKDSGRHSFTPSPSPCPSHYSYSNPSPTQSIDLHYHHGSSCQTLSELYLLIHTSIRFTERRQLQPISDRWVVDISKRNQRIRIPSNPSVTSKSSAGKVSSSSIEKAFLCF
ncbi:disks large 5 [Caerostris extrusa]|uniref:Disks large 5 n=1 Tax=Caerostris extrusa TaxID=172846 RepID=A0AAV4Y9E1_CAEEX|nr:disks large 5 [Caerostris extrusa]